LILTGGLVARRVVKVTWVDLVSLTLNLHRLSVATAGSLSVVSIEVSSAKVAMRVLGDVGRSAI
jgi:hypothetical protein